jgi:hypothetical protein
MRGKENRPKIVSQFRRRLSVRTTMFTHSLKVWQPMSLENVRNLLKGTLVEKQWLWRPFAFINYCSAKILYFLFVFLRCLELCALPRVGGAKVDEAIRCVFAALVWHSQRLRDELVLFGMSLCALLYSSILHILLCYTVPVATRSPLRHSYIGGGGVPPV